MYEACYDAYHEAGREDDMKLSTVYVALLRRWEARYEAYPFNRWWRKPPGFRVNQSLVPMTDDRSFDYVSKDRTLLPIIQQLIKHRSQIKKLKLST